MSTRVHRKVEALPEKSQLSERDASASAGRLQRAREFLLKRYRKNRPGGSSYAGLREGRHLL